MRRDDRRGRDGEIRVSRTPRLVRIRLARRSSLIGIPGSSDLGSTRGLQMADFLPFQLHYGPFMAISPNVVTIQNVTLAPKRITL